MLKLPCDKTFECLSTIKYLSRSLIDLNPKYSDLMSLLALHVQRIHPLISKTKQVLYYDHGSEAYRITFRIL